jgi:TPR repeat protein
MHISRLAVGAVIAVLLSCNAIAWASEDCAAAYDRKDYAPAVQPCLSLAEHGDAHAQLSLGGLYYNGQGVQQDYAEAAKWTRKAAE